MAKKTLLSEGHIRKFMKLAAIEPLTENFLAEAEDEAPEDEPMDDEEVEAEVEAPGEEGDEMMGAPEDEAADGMVSIEELMTALKRALEEVTGEPVSVSDGADAEMATDEDETVEEMMYDTKPVEEDLYEELNESVQVIDTQSVVKEVSRRVAQRLIKESKQEQLAEALAAKIAARLG